MWTNLRNVGRSLFKRISILLVLGGLSFGRTKEPKPLEPKCLSVPERIEAIQKAVKQLPAEIQQPFFLRAQWGNWGNWNNWANWANWNNWNNWNNWGNWSNY